MSQMIKAVSPETLQSWGVSPEAKIDYYDGKVLVVDDGSEEVGIGTMAKFGCSLMFGVAVFTHAPLVGATLFAYSAYKMLSTVGSMYGGNQDLASRIGRDLGLDTSDQPIASSDFENRFEDAVVTYRPGTQTRLGAIEVPSSPAADSSHETTALSALLRSPFLSRALFGAQRTGKSYLAAVASAEMTKTGVNIFHLNLMSYGSEDAEYWQHAKKSIRCDLPALSVIEGKPFIKQAIALVAEFVQTPNSLLIVDEWAYMASTANPHRESLVGLLNDISSQITSLSSAGIKRQRGLWAISPEFVAGSLVPQGKAVKKLQLVYVTIHPDRWVDWKGNAIGFSDELFQQVANNFPIELPNSMELPECDRIVYIDRQWLPVGELPSLEDSKPLKQAIKLNDRQQLEAAFKASTPDQEAPIEEAKSNISRPNLPAKDLLLAIAMLAEWMEENLEVEPEKIYEKYNARRKGFSRPEIRFLLTQIENLNAP